MLVDFDDRFRRRKLYTGQGGLAFLLDLPDYHAAVRAYLDNAAEELR